MRQPPRFLRLLRPPLVVAVVTGVLLLAVGTAFAVTGLRSDGDARAGVTAVAATERPPETGPAVPEQAIAPSAPTPTVTEAPAQTSSPAPAPPASKQATPATPAPPAARKTTPPAATPKAAPAPAAAAVATTNFYVTGYGQPDNDPPGPAIAYPGPAPRHARVGGVGSYADPVTIAVGSDRAGMNLVPGTRIYLPRFAKYGVIEDLCAACKGRWLDVFDGSEANDSPAKVAACQSRHTGTYAVEINPPDGRRVDTRPLYSKGACVP